jgi:hypothetical protein
MTLHLVVTKAFLRYTRGDIITDPDKIRDILAGEHRRFVTRVASPSVSKG